MSEQWLQERLAWPGSPEPGPVVEVRNLPWRDLTAATVVELPAPDVLHRMLAEVGRC